MTVEQLIGELGPLPLTWPVVVNISGWDHQTYLLEYEPNGEGE